MESFEEEEEEDTIVVLLFLACIRKYQQYKASQRRRRSPRRFFIRPLNRSRRKLWHYRNLVTFMKEHDQEQFFKYTRMTPAQFDHLLILVQPHLKKKKTMCSLSPGQQLIMTLHYLPEGCSMQQIAWDYYVGKTTVHKVIKKTCIVLWNVLVPLYMPSPTKADLNKIIDGYYKRWNIPNCFGAVDGKHVSIQAPQHSGTEYFSYKKSFSLSLMAVCDAFYKFIYVNIGAPGSQHDSTSFRQTDSGKGILNETWPIPDARPLPGMTQNFPCYLVADQAFPLIIILEGAVPQGFIDNYTL